MDGKNFLDLFSGTGRVALEACRRGAIKVFVVEADKGLSRRLREVAGLQVLSTDVRRALPYLVKGDVRFDVIFADPPYCLNWCRELAKAQTLLWELLKPQGVFVVEHSTREPLLEFPSSYWENVSKKYGETVLSFFWRREKEGK